MDTVGNDPGIAETLAALSLAEDLANGNPPETALRAAVIAGHLLKHRGESETVIHRGALVTLLRFLGCTAYAPEEADLTGDDLQYKRAYGGADPADALELMRRSSRLVEGKRLPTRLRFLTRAAFKGKAVFQDMVNAQCDTAELLGAGLGLGPSTRKALQQIFERADGKGEPRGLDGDTIELPARAANLAYNYLLPRDGGGIQSARHEINKRAGTQLDAALTRELLSVSGELEGLLNQSSVWEEALGFLLLNEIEHTHRCAETFADFADLKSRFTMGHSRRTAALARDAAGVAGMPAELRDEIETGALLMNIGMTSVSTGTIDKPGHLTRPERDRIELHPYYTDRILAGVRAWSGPCALATQVHERPDGSGYHQRRTDMSLAAALLSTSDALTAMTSERAHRPAYSIEEAGNILIQEAEDGRRNKNAVRIVLEAAGLKPRRDRAGQDRFGLTGREAEVLRLIAVGHSNKKTADLLGISARTVQHHTIRIYEKLGVNSRAAATLLASRNGLLD